MVLLGSTNMTKLFKDEAFGSEDHIRDQKRLNRFTVSHMNNTKWRRVFHAIADAVGTAELRSEWKFIDTGSIIEYYRMPQHGQLLEDRFTDGTFQLYEYKWIEWIRFPRAYYEKCYHHTRQQDLRALELALAQCNVKVVSTDEYVMLVAYECPIAS
jgi:hypothetical protein